MITRTCHLLTRFGVDSLWALSPVPRTFRRHVCLTNEAFLPPDFTCKRKSTMSTMDRPKVFVTRPDIPQPALHLLRESFDVVTWTEPKPCPRDVLLKNVQGIQGLFCTISDNIDEQLLAAAGESLKVIATMSVGHDHVNVSALKAKGVKLGYTPDVLTDATAELTVAVLLAASRRLFEAHRALLDGEWGRSAWGPTWMMGMGLADSTVGIFGMGRIGQAVMKRLVPFGVSQFLYSGRGKRDDVEGATFVDFDDLCRSSDFVICTAALTPETKEIFNARAFGLMKPTCVFVNTSRGGLVQQDDLIRVLKEDKIFAAGLDVMTPEPLPVDHELAKLRNCVVIPHIGSATIQSRTAMAMLTSENIIAGIKGKKLPHEI